MEDLKAYETFDEMPLLKLKTAALELLNEMTNPLMPRRWLSITGVSGLGKTYIAKMVLKLYRQKIQGFRNHLAMNNLTPESARLPRFDAHFCSWGEVVEELRNKNYRIIPDLRDVAFLVVDDIGTEDKSSFIEGKLYELLSGRLGKWTIITSNKDSRDIAAQERRIASRMVRDGNVLINVRDSQDYSLRKFYK